MTNLTLRRAGAALAATAALLAGCAETPEAGNSQQPGESESATGAPAPGEAGFTEYPIGDPIEVGPIEVSGVYFQPVDLDPPGMGLAASESDMHLEADISATKENGLGYGAGDFVPGLTVDYEITDPSGEVQKGTFMPMNASDGPHYGANLKFGDGGTYKVKFIVHSPADSGWVVHTDETTGVEGRFWTSPLEAEWDFDYVPREW